MFLCYMSCDDVSSVNGLNYLDGIEEFNYVWTLLCLNL